MGPLAKFLLSLTSLVRSGAIKKIPDAVKFAEQQFGKVNPLLKKQIEKVFDLAKKPAIGKPGKKEGTVLPFIKETGKEPKGLETLDVSEFDESMGDLEQMLNPRRPGGSLDPATGLTRSLARRILDKKGIEIGKKDPIDVFTDTFGEAINDVNNLAEEMIEIDARGGGMKDMDQMLEIEGLFDIEIPKNPSKGLTDEELLEFMKKTEEEEVIKNFDPKGRKPNADGGLNSLMASAPDPMDERNNMMETLSEKYYNKPLKDLTPKEIKALEEAFDDLVSRKKKEAPSIKLAGGGLAYLMGM